MSLQTFLLVLAAIAAILAFVCIVRDVRCSPTGFHITYISIEGKSWMEFDFKLLRNSVQKSLVFGLNCLALENLVVYVLMHEWPPGSDVIITILMVAVINTLFYILEDLRDFIRDISRRPHIVEPIVEEKAVKSHRNR